MVTTDLVRTTTDLVRTFLQINKQNEQMYTLLNICLVLHPKRIDEGVHSQLQDKYQDKKLRMQKGWVGRLFILLFCSFYSCKSLLLLFLLLLLSSFLLLLKYSLLRHLSLRIHAQVSYYACTSSISNHVSLWARVTSSGQVK